MTDRCLALIPARGGSKGVPRKNIRFLAGKPLIAYAIEVARASRLIDRVIVSTDDEETAAIARRYGAEVPFLRPAELACDDTPEWLVWQHALRFVEAEQELPGVLVCLAYITVAYSGRRRRMYPGTARKRCRCRVRCEACRAQSIL